MHVPARESAPGAPMFAEQAVSERCHFHREKLSMRGVFGSFFYRLPSAFDPISDLLFVSLSGTQGGPLNAPAHLVQNFPYMRRMIVDSCYLLDQCCNTRERPKVRLIALSC